MDVHKLQSIIENKNKELERNALDTAEALIEQIADKQAFIAQAEKDITNLRERLKALEVQQLDSQTILGS